jgi:hypothetical protein
VARRIDWDAERMEARGISEAEPIIREPYRAGWELGEYKRQPSPSGRRGKASTTQVRRSPPLVGFCGLRMSTQFVDAHDLSWVRIVVTPGAAQLFTFQPLIVSGWRFW